MLSVSRVRGHFGNMEGWEAAFNRANVADITRVDIKAQHDSANDQDRSERRRHCPR
jgi:hypothetical protein